MRGLSFFVRNFANLVTFLLPLLDKLPAKLIPAKQFEKMVSLVSRTGRHLQRYERGCRQVVGCIPYRYKESDDPSSVDKTAENIEVLVISAQRGTGMLFPKGGWEQDESMEEAAVRETLEEAGVIGNVEYELGKWQYKSKRGGILHEGCMFPLLVQKQLDLWPEKNIRKRRWVTVTEARELCQTWWMREALEELVRRQMHSQQQQQQEQEATKCK